MGSSPPFTLATAGSTPTLEASAVDDCGAGDPLTRCRAYLDKYGIHAVGGGGVDRFSDEAFIDGLCPVKFNFWRSGHHGVEERRILRGRKLVILEPRVPTKSVLAQSQRSPSAPNSSGSMQVCPATRSFIASMDSSCTCQLSCRWNLIPSLVNAKVCLTPRDLQADQ